MKLIDLYKIKNSTGILKGEIHDTSFLTMNEIKRHGLEEELYQLLEFGYVKTLEKKGYVDKYFLTKKGREL